MAKQILFIGANGSGRTHTMLVVGKVLADLKNEVVIVDNTESKGVFSYFDYNFDLENNADEIIRENMTIKYNISQNEIEKIKADYILIEDDKNNNLNLKDFYKVFIIQNYDKDKFEKNKKIIQKYSNLNDFGNVHFIFNQMMDITTDKKFLLEQLIEKIRNKTQILNNEDIEISFSEEDFVKVCVNKFNGKIKLKNYSSEFKQSLYQIINIINKDVDSKDFKKAIERRY